MAKCVYKIKLPGGKELVLPAGFSTIEKNAELVAQYVKYKDSGELNNLTQILNNVIPSQLKKSFSLKNLITKTSTLEELLEQINTRIESLGTYANIDQAIFNYLKGGKAFNRDKAEYNAEKLLKKLQEPIKADYFSGFGMSGVISMSSLKEEKDRVMISSIENSNYEYASVIPSNLSHFINALTRNTAETSVKQEDKTAKTLYGSSNPFIGSAWVTDENVVLFNKGDDLSLFLGLFKREALKLDPKALVPIIADINKEVKFKKYGKIELPTLSNGEVDFNSFSLNQFFNGIVQDGVITESTFETLLTKGKDKNIEKSINAILQLIANNIDAKDKNLLLAIKKLFWSLTPDSYGKNKLQEQLKFQQEMQKELAIETKYKQSKLDIVSATQSLTERSELFAVAETITEDLYNSVKKRIELGRDIILFPTDSGATIYATPTKISKSGQGVFIRGLRLDETGSPKEFQHVFSTQVTYRKKEDPIDPYIEGESIIEKEGYMLVSSTDLPQNIIKRYVRKGDKVSGNLVLGVYPGHVKIQTPKQKKVIDNSFYKIKSFKSALLKEEIDSEEQIKPRTMTQVTNSSDISEGDYLVLKQKSGKPLYKRVIYADKESVWYAVPTTEGYIVKSVARTGLTALKDTYGLLNISEVQTLVTELALKGTSSANFSTFTDINKVFPGDYVIIYQNDRYVYGKVLENDKVYLYDVGSNIPKQVVDIKALSNPTFLSKRDISADFVFMSLRTNSNKLEILADSQNPLHERAYYVVPKGTNIDDITQLSDNVFSIGSFKNRVNPDTEDDITELILEKMGENKNHKVYFEFESSNTKRYVKNLVNLREILYFNNLSSQTKKDLNIIQPGVYFSPFTENKGIDFNIYRVTNVDGDIVTAQLYKINNGKIITTERRFSLATLLSDDEGGKNPADKIAKLYVMNRNKRMKAVIEEIKKASGYTEAIPQINRKATETIAKKLQKKIKGLPITLEFVPADGNFKSNQKARILSTEQGEVKIQINNEIGSESDVVHEFLHLFLTPLRYKHPEIYYALMTSVLGQDYELNVTEAEEKFVDTVAMDLVKEGNVDKIFEELDTFIQGLKVVLSDFSENYTIQDDNPLTLLNTPLVDLLDINIKDKSNPLYDKSMLVTEPMMREWLNENNITLKCN